MVSKSVLTREKPLAFTKMPILQAGRIFSVCLVYLSMIMVLWMCELFGRHFSSGLPSPPSLKLRRTQYLRLHSALRLNSDRIQLWWAILDSKPEGSPLGPVTSAMSMRRSNPEGTPSGPAELIFSNQFNYVQFVLITFRML